MADLQTEQIKRSRQDSPRRGLNRVESAAYVGVGTTLFDSMVADGRMPRAKKVNGRTVWDMRALDRAFDELPDAENKTTPPTEPSP